MFYCVNISGFCEPFHQHGVFKTFFLRLLIVFQNLKVHCHITIHFLTLNSSALAQTTHWGKNWLNSIPGGTSQLHFIIDDLTTNYHQSERTYVLSERQRALKDYWAPHLVELVHMIHAKDPGKMVGSPYCSSKYLTLHAIHARSG